MRSAWYAHTAQTRAAAERAAAELATRRANDATEPPPVTAEETPSDPISGSSPLRASVCDVALLSAADPRRP